MGLVSFHGVSVQGLRREMILQYTKDNRHHMGSNKMV